MHYMNDKQVYFSLWFQGFPGAPGQAGHPGDKGEPVSHAMLRYKHWSKLNKLSTLIWSINRQIGHKQFWFS